MKTMKDILGAFKWDTKGASKGSFMGFNVSPELDIEVITNLIPASFMFEISLINFYNFSQIIFTIWFYLH